MKKLMVFAMAAMAALASCSKTELVDNSAPTPISFKAVTGSVTKGAVTSSTEFDYALGVFAFYKGDTYFGNAEFSKTNNSVSIEDPNDDTKTISLTTWEGTTPRYWPIESTLDFIVYAPYGSADTEGKVLTVSAANDEDTQKDYMYGEEYYAGFDKNATHVPVVLKHAMSLITVNFTGSQNVTVTEAKLTGAYLSGKFSVDYSSTPALSWSDYVDSETDAVIIESNNTTTLSDNALSAEWMVVPSNNSNTITFKYKMSGTELEIPAKIEINDTWVAGTNFIYNININAAQIKFTTTVTPWGTEQESHDLLEDN